MQNWCSRIIYWMHECPWIIKAIRETELQLLQTLVGWHLQRTPTQESEDWILIPTVALRTQGLNCAPSSTSPLQVSISVMLNMSQFPSKTKVKSVSFTTKQVWNMLGHLCYSHSPQKTLRELALEHAEMMTLCPHTSAGWKGFWKLFAK